MCSKCDWPVKIFTLLLMSLVSSAFAGGEAAQSDWLELVKGYRGKTMGAELIEIDEGNTAESTRKITLAIPKTAIAHPDTIEEVVVIGKMPEKSQPLDISYEWVTDYDNDNYGLVIRLSKDTKWPIRLYMSSEEGFVR